MKKSEVLVVVSILFLILVLTPNESTSSEVDYTPTEDVISNKFQKSNLVTHDPFNISSNADFISQGWPGSGSQGDPYVIEGLSIVSMNRCIYISETTAWFIIRNCSFSNPVSYPSFSLIELNNTRYGRISNCTFSDSRHSQC